MGIIIHDVEQGSEDWHALRAGMPTASEFSKLVTSTGAQSKSFDDYALTLAAEKYAGKTVDRFSGNRYTERGHEIEPLAIADYEMENMVKAVQVGFITNTLMQYGCSPDSLIGKDGGLEVKSKIAKEHLKAVFYHQKNGAVLPMYFAQPQGCMFVTGRKWWDIKFYHPELPGCTIRQYPDKLFFKELRKQLKAVQTRRNIYIEQIKSL